MKIVLMFLGSLATSFALADKPSTWTPRIDFHLEESDYTQTLVWVSGWSYALTEVGRSNSREGIRGGVCLPQNRLVESRVLLEALNSRFKGQRITSEQASPVLLAVAKATYPCSKK
jgi:hypothetical protein